MLGSRQYTGQAPGSCVHTPGFEVDCKESASKVGRARLRKCSATFARWVTKVGRSQEKAKSRSGREAGDRLSRGRAHANDAENSKRTPRPLVARRLLPRRVVRPAKAPVEEANVRSVRWRPTHFWGVCWRQRGPQGGGALGEALLTGTLSLPEPSRIP